MPPGRVHNVRGIPCRICGAIVMTTAPYTTCPDCRNERDTQNRLARYKKLQYKSEINDAKIRILYDPDPDGGFRRGARIDSESLRCGLSMKTFTIGTIFLIDRQKKVVQDICGKYKLIPV